MSRDPPGEREQTVRRRLERGAQPHAGHPRRPDMRSDRASGCGKTTTLRMINRLIDPDSGRILVDGSDTHGVDPPALRLKMGYVIQQTGLFPHMTVGGNVGTVPKLWKWDE